MTNDANITAFRQMLTDLLDDPEGINDVGYTSIQAAVATIFSAGALDCCDDIFAACQSAKGRYYLPEDHGLKA